MSDTQVQATEPETPQAGAGAMVGAGAAASVDADPQTFDAAYVKQLRAESASYRSRLRELERVEADRSAAAEAARQSELSEVEKLRGALTKAEARARALEVAQVRSAAASAHGLDSELAEFITADDAEGALAQAAKLAAKMRPAAALPPAGGRAPSGGGEGAAKQDEADRLAALTRRVPALHNRVIRG